MSNLTRYDHKSNGYNDYKEMVPSNDGAWVKFDDIKELLNSSHNTPIMPCKCVNCGNENAVIKLCTACGKKFK